LAIYLEIRKAAEDDQQAIYIFSREDGAQGELLIRKRTGEIELKAAMPGDSEEKGLWLRAAHKIRSHWRAGEFPEVMTWAA